ncbi:rhodanese-like domain-containing protein [Streptococcus sciuri]|uniref:Rhodanese-like domain-containing protein n=1 Tax=Streptococcus sciuri TaxID=2973939 RepID=A0ABT2F7V7_9STRE|nr:rhodanese-like domain-containing protein [Streptococcus sciuri]MCS4488575.1 rhodanese-like domain-containing protein [Streptococcus sciuri]
MLIWVLVAIMVCIMLYTAWNYFRVRRSAIFLDNRSFEERMHSGQLIDIRESSAFQKKHILGARNLPASQLKNSLSAIRKDKPVLIYDNNRSQSLPRIILILKKEGYQNIYVLKDGLDYWDGKIKQR